MDFAANVPIFHEPVKELVLPQTLPFSSIDVVGATPIKG